ncbi:MAG TPA: hypothetical protein RMH99_13040 [Sandaracinaceae bacterium LLY-WYZ-13_1]|nr:hypothetical protein [Sandaracinaceae bacterium LLY-WYZ-13_1]
MPNDVLRTLRALPALAACAALLVGCGGGIEYGARGEEITPEAELEIEMARNPRDDGQWPITVEVDELPRPHELGDAVRSYAVWMVEPESETPRFVGTMTYDRDARFGQLHSTTPHDRLTVIVTAEETESPSAPSAMVIARREIHHDPS